ncbi:dyp-type peroxidase family protein [Diaporthe amygdali]|uniref:dyp-type peroxidase family protein n=1 Tax=Phomopsis amygdali TaxID=1214568 RepID=UPI0022FE6A20|nr:dyp-type peroxidase family protein [Diaporthe amygdali]KAJ0109679.1 dyp-type peroxidase family protein [Diaporthe amygdali]
MTSNIDLNNIQGDILSGLPKKAETFYFFEIDKNHVDAFRAQLANVVPLIASDKSVSSGREQIVAHKKSHSGLLSLAFANIAFSSKGLNKIGIDAAGAKDTGFTSGMLPDAKELGDAGTSADGKPFDPKWVPEFKKGSIDGVIVVAGDCERSVNKKLDEVLGALKNTVNKVINIPGHVRPGKEDGHEHFGFLDGISNPAVAGVNKDLSGQGPVQPGVILLGRDGDPVTDRQGWTKDGSFLAFRFLQQLVPEFDRFLELNAPRVNDPAVNTAELLGARLTGRWKSGAPTQVTPLHDDPKLAADPTRNNVFTFDNGNQEKCPFAAHVRKMNPRGDIDQVNGINPHRVIRRGIQYGPEVNDRERKQHKTEKDRGLLFVSYQSSLENGFQFLQKRWANATNFPPDAPPNQLPGFDPLIGQVDNTVHNEGQRSMTGSNPQNVAATLDLGFQVWVVPKGGEYFFSPSISVLRDTFAKNANGVNGIHVNEKGVNEL